MRALVLLLLLVLAPAAAGQSVLERAQARLAAGDSAGAHALTRDALRHDPDPDDAGALGHLRLRLELAGFGTRGLPRPFRHQQLTDVARRLRRDAPADTLALRVLTQDAVWTVIDWHDRIDFVDVSSPVGDFVDPVEMEKRLAASRFDLDQRAAMGDVLDRSQRAQRARVEAAELLDAWRAADPTATFAYLAAATLSTIDQEWGALAEIADRFRAATGDPRADLFAGLAAFRLGDVAAAGAAFDRALPRLPASARAPYDDARLLIPVEDRAAYDADPAAAAAAFWAAADPRLLTAVSERRIEHRARVAEADLLFGWTEAGLFRRAPGGGAETEQGQLWIRYGRPPLSVSFTPGDFDPNVYGSDANFRIWTYADGLQLAFDDPEYDGEFRRYSPPAWAFGGASRSAQRDDFVLRDQALQRDDPERSRLAPTVEVPVLASRFRAPGGGTDVILAWGVSADSLAPPVRTGAFALAGGRVVDRAEQTRARLAPGRVVRAGGAPVWAEAAQVTLAGSGAVRVEVEADGGAAWGAADTPVVPLGTGFGVSDLLLATSVDDEGRGPVVRDGLGIVPAPRAAFATADPVYVVLEVYGLGLDDGRTRTTVEALLRPVARRGGLLGRVFGRGQGPGVAVRTEASGSDPDDLVSFFIDVRDQDPGAYTLTVTVRDETTGRSASAERAVVLE